MKRIAPWWEQVLRPLASASGWCMGHRALYSRSCRGDGLQNRPTGDGLQDRATGWGSLRRKVSRRGCNRLLDLEPLEDRSLLSPMVYPSLNVPLRIPATGTSGTISSTLTVPDSFAIRHLSVTLNIDHTYDKDLRATLLSPNGTAVRLFTHVGGSNDNFTGTILDDLASQPISKGSAPFTGTYQPQDPLRVIYGLDARGVWTLTISDDSIGDYGRLNGWSLKMDTVYAPSDLPLRIPATGTVGTISSTLTVPDSFLIHNLTVALDITHTYDSDLDAVLIGPDGTRITLWSGVGGSGEDFRGTILDDYASTPIYLGSAPFTSSFRPQGQLSAFAGRNVHGVWQLVVTDTGPGDSGTLNRWSLRVDPVALLGAPVTVTEQSLPHGDEATAQPIPLTSALSGSIATLGEVDFYALQVADPGLLTISVTAGRLVAAGPPQGGTPTSLDSQVSLYSVNSYLHYGVNGLRVDGGGLLVTSDDRAPGNPDPLILQNVLPGAYFVAVSSGGAQQGSKGAYKLTATFQVTPNPYHPDVNIPYRLLVGKNPSALITDDFNRDGILDLAGTNEDSADVSVLIGVGDGTFRQQLRYSVAAGPTTLVSADFNGDGRLDLAALSEGRMVSLLPGLGDGTFLDRSDHPLRFVLAFDADSLAFGDFNRDGHADLVALDRKLGVLTFYQGQGDGNFVSQPAARVATTLSPSEMLVGDFSNDHAPDIVLLDNTRAQSRVSVLINTNQGGFALQRVQTFQLAQDFGYGLVNMDFNKDGQADLAVLGSASDDVPYVTFFPGVGDGTFLTGADRAMRVPLGDKLTASLVGHGPDIAVEGDFNRDGFLDQAGLIRDSGQARTEHFASNLALFAGNQADSNAYLDVPAVLFPSGRFYLSMLTFPPGNSITIDRNRPDPPRQIPILANLHSAGVTDLQDLVVLDQNGNIRLRAAQADHSGFFGSPMVVNDPVTASDPSRKLVARPASAVTILTTGPNAQLAATDLFSQTVSIYSRLLESGQWIWRKTDELTTGPLPLRLVAADLDRDGRNDLVAGDALLGFLSIYLAQSDGTFVRQPDIKVGITVADIGVADVNGDKYPDLLIANEASDDIGVLRNQGSAPGIVAFEPEARFRAGTGVYGLINSALAATINDAVDGYLANLHITLQQLAASYHLPLYNGQLFPNVYFGYSLETTETAAAADFKGDGILALAAVNQGTHTVSILWGKQASPDSKQASGSFSDPQPADSYPTSAQPGQIVSIILPGDRVPSLAVLMEDLSQIWIYRNNGDGTFGAPRHIDAGNNARGFTVAQVQGNPALLVDNPFGDILTLFYDGKGGFAPDRTGLQKVPLAVGTLAATGQQYAVVADQQLDKVSVYFRTPGTNRFDNSPIPINDQTQPLLAPGAVQMFSVSGDLKSYLVVANSLSNNVLVYHSLGNGQYGPPTAYAVGSNPVSVTAADVNGDGVPDLLVANKGSNDVSVLIGKVEAPAQSSVPVGPVADANTGVWSATPYQRLSSGGSGPIAVGVRTQAGSTHGPDLFVINSAGQAVTIPGVGSGQTGSGFFRDSNLVPVNSGTTIGQAVFDASSGRELVVRGDGGISAFDGTRFLSVLDPSGAGVTAIALAGDALAAAFEDGGVALFRRDAQGAFALVGEDAAFHDQVSALEVLQASNGVEVFVTRTSNEIPLILAGADFIAVGTVPLAGTVPLSEVFGLPNAEVVLVAVLLIGPTPDQAANDSETVVSDAAFASLNPFILFREIREHHQDDEPDARPAEVLLPPLAQAGDNAGQQAAWEVFSTGVEEAFQQRHWLRQGEHLSQDALDVLRRLFEQIQQWWQAEAGKRHRASGPSEHVRCGKEPAAVASTFKPNVGEAVTERSVLARLDMSGVMDQEARWPWPELALALGPVIVALSTPPCEDQWPREALESDE